MDLSISDACKRLGKKSLSWEALENTNLRNGHESKAKMFWNVNSFISTNSRMVRLSIYQI